MRLTPGLALALAALSLAGCETTQERSAKLERAAHAKKLEPRSQGLKIAAVSRTIDVRSATALHSAEGTAVVVTLANRAGARREVPVLITVAQRGGPAVSNAEAGLARSLTSLAYVPAHGSAVWVDDQVTLSGSPLRVTAKVGVGRPLAGKPPSLVLGPHSLEREAGGEVVTGTVRNASTAVQRELPVYAVAMRAGHPVAAGRGVIESLAPGASSRFQIFLIGASAKGAKLVLSAAPSTF